MKNKIFKSLAVIGVVIGLTGCAAKKDSAQSQELINGTWQLVEQSDVKDINKAFPQGVPTLTFESGKEVKIYGKDGCNGINTTAKLKKNNSIEVNPNYVSTLMYCDKVKDTEFKMLFTTTSSYEVTENVLILKSDKGSLKFHKVSLNGKWVLDKIFTVKEKVSTLYPYKKPFINIDINSTQISGNTACNSINGKMLIHQNTIKFNHLAMTKMFCEGINEQAFTNALSKTSHYKLDGTRLTLLENDKPLLEFVREFEK